LSSNSFLPSFLLSEVLGFELRPVLARQVLYHSEIPALEILSFLKIELQRFSNSPPGLEKEE
jgi:hypothetical protein